jgi:DNA-binding CsgD family transcriptional regulator
MRDADAAASTYPSAYVREFAVAAHGEQALAFGDLSAVIDAGHRLVAAPTRPIQQFGYCFLALGGLLGRDDQAVEEACSVAQRFAARQVPGSQQLVDTAECIRDLLSDGPLQHRPTLPPRINPWIAARDAVDRGDTALALTAAETLRQGGSSKLAMAHAICGLVHRSDDEWHDALRLAAEHGLRLIAADALEALGESAAVADSAAEALRLLAAAHRLREETGYAWRHPGEQAAHDAAMRAARLGLGDDGDSAWREGLTLDLAHVLDYARRARGDRGRPRHGWASLTPTEQRVVELVAHGLTNPEIAEQLLMARGTVKTHLEHVFAKTGLRNRAELAAAVVRNNDD